MTVEKQKYRIYIERVASSHNVQVAFNWSLRKGDNYDTMVASGWTGRKWIAKRTARRAANSDAARMSVNQNCVRNWTWEIVR
jgi:hypothetical protein